MNDKELAKDILFKIIENGFIKPFKFDTDKHTTGDTNKKNLTIMNEYYNLILNNIKVQKNVDK